MMKLQFLQPLDGDSKVETVSGGQVSTGREFFAEAKLPVENRVTVSPFRPSWWPDIDPVTGKSVLLSLS